MKTRVLRSFIALALSVGATLAGPVTLLWDDPNTAPDIAGYIVNYGQVGTTVTNQVLVAVPTKQHTFTNLPVGKYYWWTVQVTNTAKLKSDPSTVLLASIPVGATNLSITQP